ncbi:3-coathanger stack domain-containing protein [Leptobacterium sp. I13]|uniref:RHS repeat domain-containing protein n=1 Tax=Leptobacterium meishanense TaxID=3128904 RepID=UPI0030EDA944
MKRLFFIIIFINSLVNAQEPAPVPADNKNWISGIRYDLQGTTVFKNVNYFNLLGKPVQTQNWDVLTGKRWISETYYDYHGRNALQTFGTPIGGSLFAYEDNFVLKATNNEPYSVADYDTNATNVLLNTIDNPKKVAPIQGTLGWYYSNNNTDEPFQDMTDYPFSRIVYSTLTPGTILKAIGGNKVNTGTEELWPQSYSFTMPAAQELAQAGAFNDPGYSNVSRKVLKTVSRDPHGIETVTFSDSDGNILATARSGNEENPLLPKRLMTLSIGKQGYVDIHLPTGCSGITITNPYPDFVLTSMYDLTTEKSVFESPASLPPGLYRIKVTLPVDYDIYNPITLSYQENYYDYALNYYDKAGRLIDTRQPLNHLSTTFAYNSLGQLQQTTSPDEGTARFKYRKDGQIRYSQNSKQAITGEFSYTNYDALGRPTESGVVFGMDFTTADPDAPLTSANTTEQQVTLYDIPDQATLDDKLTTAGIASFLYKQRYVAGNVSKTYNEDTTSWYSYDIYGRLVWLVQDISGLGIKTIDYEYDFAKGNISKAIYQKHIPAETFIHKYTYDLASQLIKVETSTDDLNYTTHADYEYYETGALKRVNLAQGLQGIDYVYNLAGQLKNINHPSLSPTKDPGGDANDLFGMAIDYHSADYLRNNNKIETTTYGTDRFDGNIKGLRWNNGFQPLAGAENIYSYSYNRNNWLTGAQFGQYSTPTGIIAEKDVTATTVVTSGNTLNLQATNSIRLLPGFHGQGGSTVTAKIVDVGGLEENTNGDYNVTGITYDANGNIQTLNRNKNTESNTNAMDAFTYHYTLGTNQLDHVEDAVTTPTAADDLQTQPINNYIYNSIGQLIKDENEFLTYTYNASGLVTKVSKNCGGITPCFNSSVSFFYNDRGQRIKKEQRQTTGVGAVGTNTYYVRDVAGNVMAIYTEDALSPSPLGPTLVEQPIYGNNRLGIYFRQSGSSVYQLTDHLGNVRAVVSSGGLTNATDYYPGGMPMPNRQLTDGTYRYGYQGDFAETDPETGKPAFELRLYDPRINRWLTTDPAGQYHSPYLSMGNNWVNRIDPDGGMDCPDPPCNNIAAVQLNEVTVTARGQGFFARLWGGFKSIFGFGGQEVTELHELGFHDEAERLNRINNENLNRIRNIPDNFVADVRNTIADAAYNAAPDGLELIAQVTVPYTGIPGVPSGTFGGSYVGDSYGNWSKTVNGGAALSTSNSLSISLSINYHYSRKHNSLLTLDDYNGWSTTNTLDITTPWRVNLNGSFIESEVSRGFGLGLSNFGSPSYTINRTYTRVFQ